MKLCWLIILFVQLCFIFNWWVLKRTQSISYLQCCVLFLIVLCKYLSWLYICSSMLRKAGPKVMCAADLCPAGTKPGLGLYLIVDQTGYHSPLNDFQRSEGRELVPTSWNSARVSLLSGLNLEDCAQRCAQSLDCRYPSFGFFHCQLFPGKQQKAVRVVLLQLPLQPSLKENIFILCCQYGGWQSRDPSHQRRPHRSDCWALWCIIIFWNRSCVHDD